MSETANHLPESKLVIIGEGRWGKKVQAVLSRAHLETSSISAREFVFSSQQEKSLEKDVTFWICTKPDLQLRILEELIQLEAQKVILEKPCFTSMDDFNNLSVMIGNDSITKLFVSEPWRHSALWEDAKSKIIDLVDDSGCVHIQINRGSNELRDFINPVQDWIPHDLSLLFDLALELGGSEPQILGVPVIKNDLMQGSISITDNIKIDFSIGFSPAGRIAQWLVSKKNEMFTIDFTELKILSQEFPEGVPTTRYTQDNPIMTQYEWVSRQSHDPHLLGKLEIQKMALLSA
jgi:hypothetical protein